MHLISFSLTFHILQARQNFTGFYAVLNIFNEVIELTRENKYPNLDIQYCILKSHSNDLFSVI